jgi:lipocalin-like protein
MQENNMIVLIGNAARFAFAVALTAAPACAAEVNLVGTYELLGASTSYLDTGEVIPDIFGKTPRGFVTFGAEGRMLAFVTNSDRPKPESIGKTTNEQRIALYKSMQAYAGTYTFDGRTVVIKVDICWDEVRCGTTVARDAEQDGDKLVYKTHPAPFSANGRMAVTTLTWRKVK